MTYQPLGYRVDDTEQGNRVRRLLAKIRALGVQVLIMDFRGRMITGRSSDIDAVVPNELRPEEEYHIRAFVSYARSLGFEVAFRPILLVVGPHWEFPYVEGNKYWWHGNIEPSDIESWFQNYYAFHDRYVKLAADLHPKWYSLGSEMHSMTVGLGSRYRSWRFGFPAKWVQMIQQVRTILPRSTQLTYGINYTDQYVLENQQQTWGGEFEQWRHDITFAPQTSDEVRHQNDMRDLWRNLDFLGVDYYRALGSNKPTYPSDFATLADMLTTTTRKYAIDVRESRNQMSQATGAGREIAIQEVGYRSVDKCFVFPYHYEGGNEPINYIHQGAAWEALLRAVTDVPYYGVGIWQVLLDEDSDLKENPGFSPLGKEPLTSVLQKYFLNQQPTKSQH